MHKVRTTNLAFREIDGEIVLLDLDGSRYLNLNPSAAALWELLVVGAEDAALCDRLIEKFGIDEETAAADVASFIAVLRSRGLLEP